MNDHDALLREALGREAERLDPQPDWADVVERSRRGGRRWYPAAAAAVLVVVVLASAFALTRGDEATVVTDPPPVAGQPDAADERPAETTGSAEPVDLPAGAPLAPGEIVAVLQRGEGSEALQDLVVLDPSGAIDRTLVADAGTAEGGLYGLSITPDGRTVLATRATSACGNTVMAAAADGSGAAVDLFEANRAVLSPDGSWLAVDTRSACEDPMQLELRPVDGGPVARIGEGIDARGLSGVSRDGGERIGTVSSMAFLDADTLWYVAHDEAAEIGGLHEFELGSGDSRRIDPLATGPGAYRWVGSTGPDTVTLVHDCCDGRAERTWTTHVAVAEGDFVRVATAGSSTEVVERAGTVAADFHFELRGRNLVVGEQVVRSDVVDAVTRSVRPSAVSGTRAAAAEELFRSFADALVRDDLEAASSLWTGYPEADPDDESVKQAELRRLQSSPLFDALGNIERVRVTPAWPGTRSQVTIAAVLVDPATDERSAVAALADVPEDGPARLVRLPELVTNDRIDPGPGSTVSPGDVIVIEGIPTEGGALAWFDGRPVEVALDLDTFTMRVVVPEGLDGLVLLSLSVATPEEPGPAAWVLVVEP